jgi:FkbM family methyltransferase
MEKIRTEKSHKISASLSELELLVDRLAKSESKTRLSVDAGGVVLYYYPPAPPAHPYGTAEILELKLDMDSLDYRDAPFTIFLEGEYEKFLCATLIEIACNSSVFVDVGANIGFYSVLSSIANPGIEVHSFEPNPKLWRRFRKNLELNGSPNNVKLHETGLGSEGGTVKLFVPPTTGSGGGSLINQHVEEGAPAILDVRLEALDALTLGEIELMKIDVEGAELSVIQGAQETIAFNHPTIFIELLRKWMKPFGTHPMDVVRILSASGYHLFAISEKGLRSCSEIDDATTETNFLFVHPDRATHFKIVEEIAHPLNEERQHREHP